eukprot:TRINITY_DN12844_c0_g2_i5.p1 TRINITY_DN12844_c0_g2~~TRINITY_DN12844_c0_g2_i5.p1  ORF type:complete len:293 (+),score=35.56 TRINITY_DN12844_c0_g2_i5:95-880(+)
MVTHNWENLFRDLVAAIVADALELDEFGIIAVLLENDFEMVERLVSTKGVDMTSYWVCAFAVNQHTGICGSNPQETRDVVSGNLHPTCRCDAPKAWHDTAPQTADGRSVACQMNKFDDMMMYLSAKDLHFRHMIAVDASCKLFSRAWCVAELATGYDLGLRQKLKIRSVAGLTLQEQSLKNMSIENMSASCPEDLERILAKISDKAAFDQRVRKMLLGELMPELRHVEWGVRLRRLERLMRWKTLCDHLELSREVWLDRGM